MSSKETRSKSIAELPNLRLTEIKKQSQSPSIIDPRSPSANVRRTPVDKETYQLPNPTLK